MTAQAAQLYSLASPACRLYARMERCYNRKRSLQIRIAVKGIDFFGHDAMTIIEITVRGNNAKR